MKFTGGEFGDGKITVDGGIFDRCKFNNTILVYNGGELPKFTHCTFNNTSWFFDGAAGATLNFMRSLYGTPFKPMVQQMLDFVSGKVPAPGEPE